MAARHDPDRGWLGYVRFVDPDTALQYMQWRHATDIHPRTTPA